MSGNRLGGRQGTAYTGTNAPQPPNWSFEDRDPNQYDVQNYALGDLWLNRVSRTVWVLVSLAGDSNSKGALADWEMFGGDLDSLTGNTGGAVFGDINRNINVLGDTTTINVTGNPGTNTLTISTSGTGVVSTLTGNSGTASPVAGNINIVTANSTPLFVGAGDTLTLDFMPDANGNLLLGSSGSLTTGINNAGYGQLSASSVTSGALNSCYGISSGTNLTTGDENILIGYQAGLNLTTESDNVHIASLGVPADSGTIRIGTNAVQTSCFITGIDGVNVGSVARVVTESSDQLGTAIITAGTGVTVTPGANTITIASTGGLTGPSYSNIGLTINTGAGTITVHSASGAAFSASNAGIVIFPSKVTLGTFVTITITSNVTMNFSDMNGNTMGTVAGTAWANDMPLYLYAVLNAAENAATFGWSRVPNHGQSSVAANIGTPASATANAVDNSAMFLFQSVTIADYASNPVVALGSAVAQKNAADQWTFSALALNDTGIGNFNENTVFTMPYSQNGSDAGGYYYAPGGTSPLPNAGFALVYSLKKNGDCFVDHQASTLSATVGVGAVTFFIMMPYFGAQRGGSGFSMGTATPTVPGMYKAIIFLAALGNGYAGAEFAQTEPTRLLANDFSVVGGYFLSGSLNYSVLAN